MDVNKSLPHPNLKKKKPSHFQIDQQILYQNHHWTIKKVARATDGIKSLSIAVLEPNLSFGFGWRRALTGN